MRFLTVLTVLGIILAGSLFFSRSAASGQAPSTAPANQSGPAGSTAVNPDAPDALTSFTISNPYCYQPDPAQDKCYVNFRFIQANDNQTVAPYMTWLIFKVSNKVRYSSTSFFEGTITYSYDMTPQGFEVPCGAPNAGSAGDAFGNVYSVVVQPLDSSRNPMSTDTANITCPAYAP